MRTKALCFCLLAIATAARADIIAQWNFNDTSNTNSPVPFVGSGIASLVNVLPASSGGFATGSTTDPSSPNTAWNTATYPPQGTSNKTAGVQFAVNTAGYSNISVSFDMRTSGTASKYWRLQYTTNGTDFVDTIVLTNGSTSFTSKTNSFVGLPGVDRNPGFAIRIVAEWESSAIGTVNSNYVGATGAYGQSGTLRYDMVTLWGIPTGTPNTPPVMSVLSDQTIRINHSANQSFSIGDLETPAASLVVTGASSNPTLVPADRIVVTSSDGSGSNRVVTVAPLPDQTGSATITLTVVDGGTLTAARSFLLTVLPANTPPVMSGLLNTNTLAGTPVTLAFTIGDAETDASNLILSSNSTYTTLLPPSGISYGGSGSNRTVTITPAPNQIGVAAMTVTVSDGVLSTNVTFAVMVVPISTFLFYEPFGYNNAPLVGANSGNLWQHHSGALTGEVAVVSGAAVVDEALAEDVNARLIGAPYTSASSGSLYTKCRMNLTYLPAAVDPSTNLGTYFLHLKDDGTSNFRARLFIGTTNAAANTFRLGIANSTGGFTQYPQDFSPGVDHIVVTRYELASGVSTLWVDPANERDFSVTATDAASLTNITTVALRESMGMGSIVVDDLIVASTFAAALGDTNPPANTPPVISSIPPQSTQVGVPVSAIPFTIGDAETPATDLTLLGSSSNPTLVPEAGITFGGNGSNRTVTVTPAPGQYGAVTISVRVSDGVLTNMAAFTLTVSLPLVLADSFSYADGPIITNSSFFWNAHSGATGETQVASGRLLLSDAQSEDINASLTNAPYAPGAGAVLYAGLTVNFSQLPGSQYFAHFKDASASGFAGRIFATVSNAAANSFRLGVANGTGTMGAANPPFPQDLSLNRDYRVIVRYNVSTGISTLWVNPAAETDSSVTATDPPSTLTVTSFAFRQSDAAGGMGALAVDDLKVGTTFNAVLAGSPSAPRLRISAQAGAVLVAWPTNAPDYGLQSTLQLSPTGWRPVGTPPATVNGWLVVTNNNPTGNLFYRLAK
jgi:hypothetical protein